MNSDNIKTNFQRVIGLIQQHGRHSANKQRLAIASKRVAQKLRQFAVTEGYVRDAHDELVYDFFENVERCIN